MRFTKAAHSLVLNKMKTEPRIDDFNFFSTFAREAFDQRVMYGREMVVAKNVSPRIPIALFDHFQRRACQSRFGSTLGALGGPKGPANLFEAAATYSMAPDLNRANSREDVMWSDFFKAGGFGMYPTLLFGFLSVATGVLYLLRTERRYVVLVLSWGITTLGSGLLSFCVGVANTFRYLEQVSQADQIKIAALGCQESLNNVILALILLVLAALIVSLGAFRALRIPGVPSPA